MTTGTPLRRLDEDRNAGEDLKFNLLLSKTTQMLFPGVEADVRVFELVRARTTFADVHHTINDIRGQTLIALLDTSASLNKRSGAKHPDCSPSQEVAHGIAKLDTRTFAALQRTTTAAWPHTSLVREYTSHCQSYTIGKTASPMTDNY